MNGCKEMPQKSPMPEHCITAEIFFSSLLVPTVNKLSLPGTCLFVHNNYPCMVMVSVGKTAGSATVESGLSTKTTSLRI